MVNAVHTKWIRLKLFLKWCKVSRIGLRLMLVPLCPALEHYWVQDRRQRKLFAVSVFAYAECLVRIVACGAESISSSDADVVMFRAPLRL